MLARRLNAKALSQKAGLGGTYVFDLIDGKNLSPSMPALQAIAKVLGTSVAYLVGETDHVHPNLDMRIANLMPLVGIVESGTFRKPPVGEVPNLVQRPMSQGYPTAKHFALYVNDDAMGAAREGPILPGMEVLCIDLVDAELAVESNKLYAVRRTEDGRTFETIVRRVMVFRDRVELVAESSQIGVYDKIIVPGRLTTDREQPIYAIGLVYGLFQGFE